MEEITAALTFQLLARQFFFLQYLVFYLCKINTAEVRKWLWHWTSMLWINEVGSSILTQDIKLVCEKLGMYVKMKTEWISPDATRRPEHEYSYKNNILTYMLR